MIRGLLILFALLLSKFSLDARQPNIVVFLTDDQGWGDLSVNGNTNLSTPNIDSLAKDGVKFDRFYVCPVCSPTRAEFLTGRYHQRGGVYSTSAGGERLDLDEVTIGDTFKAAGYSTGAFGKWHNGMQFPYHPNGRGFDEFYGFCSGHWGNYFDPMLEHNGKIVDGEGFCVDDFTDKAMAFIEGNKEKPFLCYVPYNTPHSPMQVPDNFWDKFKNKELAMRHREPEKEQENHVKCALAMCENIDWNVGRVLKKLEELKLEEDTIVIYFCDNGPNGARWNGGMKGKKGSTDEGGVRSPMLIRWPGKIKGGREVSVMGSAIDLLPTLADMAEVPLKSEKPLDGTSLKSALLGDADPELADRLIFSSWKNKSTVRSSKFRVDTSGKLFNLSNDPGQARDISKENKGLLEDLDAKRVAYFAEMKGELGTDERPFVIAHPGHQFSQIPARDATASGEIKRSNKFPNDSFFLNWVNKEDHISWDAKVEAAGDYEVEMFYTCPEDSVGTELELSFNENKLLGRISEFHNPPLKGADDDRQERVESYVKDWKRMGLGTITLSEGEGTLSLKALKKPGKEVIDFRLFVLRRVE